MAFDPAAHEFLTTFLDVAAPARSERAAAEAFMSYASTFASTRTDASGNCFAARGAGDGPRIAVCGHLDEIGLAVSEIDAAGFLRFTTIGSWDPSVLVGQRVLVRGRDGDLVDGVIGRPGIHILRVTGAEQRAADPAELWIDIAVSSASEAQELVAVGAPVVLASEPRFVRNHIIARSLDNRIGTFVALEALRAFPADHPGEFVVAATVQEEVGGAGARAAAPQLDVDAILVVDLSPSSDTPAGHPLHELVLGRGPGFNQGPSNDEQLVAQLRAVAHAHDIAYQVRNMTTKSSTDADRFAEVLPDTPCALLSIPARYAHTPSTIVSASDVAASTRLISAWAQSACAPQHH